MIRRNFASAILCACLPLICGANWLITTHSGDDVLIYDDKKKSVKALVKPGEGFLKQARGVTVSPRGDLYVCSAAASNWAILRYNRDGKFKGAFAAGDGLAHPYQCLFGPDGDLYVAGQDNNAVLRYDGKTGKSRGAFVKPRAGGLDGIRGIAFHPDGDLLVAGRENNSILRFTAKTGIPKVDFVSESGGKLDHPIQLRYGPDGYLYVSSGKNSRIMRYDGKTGRLIGTFVKHKSGGLDHPSGFDWGAEGDLYVASRDSHQILRYDGKTGAFKAVVLDRKDEKQMKSPEFLLMIN